MATEKKEKVRVRCAHDDCCEFEQHGPKHIYCTEHNCRRRHEMTAKRLTGDESTFVSPLNYSKLEISRKDVKDGTRVIIVNDLQMPFHDAPVVEAVERFWNDWKPDIEVYNGDIFDFYGISDHLKNPSRKATFQDEIDLAKTWLYNRRSANPDARPIFIEGNHEDRLRRFLWKWSPELSSLTVLTPEVLLGLNEFGFERLNYKSQLNLLGFLIEHGDIASGAGVYTSNVAAAMAKRTASSGLCGHTHRLGQYHWRDSRGSHKYIENGCLCFLQLEYAAFPNWQQGFTYAEVWDGVLYPTTLEIYGWGFIANGERYPVIRKGGGRTN